MDAVPLIRRLHQHRAWVTRNLLTAAAQLSEEQLRAPFPIGQGSIWKSLLHLYAAEYVWLDTLLGNESGLTPGDLQGKLPGNQEGEGAIRNLDELRQKWSTLDERWSAYLATLEPDTLDGFVYRVSSAFPGKRLASRRSDALLHVCTHAQYTTAQVVNMLRHTGVEKLPDVMLMALRGRKRNSWTR